MTVRHSAVYGTSDTWARSFRAYLASVGGSQRGKKREEERGRRRGIRRVDDVFIAEDLSPEQSGEEINPIGPGNKISSQE